MNAADIKKAVVIGAGTMGRGIAQTLAMVDVQTTLVDLDPAMLETAMAQINANLEKGVARGKVTDAVRAEALKNLNTATEWKESCPDANVVIEAVPEILDLKRKIFKELGEHYGPEVLLATNTSSLPISKIADAAKHSERVTGMHFFNPVHIMKLVEVVRAKQSSPEAIQASIDLATRMGKEPISVKDSPGFASSRLGLVIGLEAIRMLESGVASAEDIDKAMTLGYGFPMGPLKLTDLVGLDVRLSIAEYLSKEVGKHFQPPELLRQKVAAGELGKKSGRGFYEW
ncbi:MAG: 3-hydroxyacyl-CoA dehydrogenase family protein [Planctomycetota bacterium]|nr:3-hydroxyacyl-CoA dehydrogenase family protein [Planctomycetota bacterium]